MSWLSWILWSNWTWINWSITWNIWNWFVRLYISWILWIIWILWLWCIWNRLMVRSYWNDLTNLVVNNLVNHIWIINSSLLATGTALFCNISWNYRSINCTVSILSSIPLTFSSLAFCISYIRSSTKCEAINN